MQCDRVIESFTVDAAKAEILVINEHKGGYVPLFYGQCYNVSFLNETDSLELTGVKFIKLQVGLDYFHP